MKIVCKTSNMITQSREPYHCVSFDVNINGKNYILVNRYDVDDYLLEAYWVGKAPKEDAVEFTIRYTLNFPTAFWVLTYESKSHWVETIHPKNKEE